MSGCSLVAGQLPSQVNGAVPTFAFDKLNYNYFGVPVTYMSGSTTCSYTSGVATFTPYVYSGTKTATCDFNSITYPPYSEIVCSNVPVTSIPNGAYTIGYAGVKGISSSRSPLPYTFTIGTSPSPGSTVTVTTSTAGTTTSTATAVAQPAATTTQTAYTSTVTQTNTVSSNTVITDAQTKYVSSCAPTVPAPNVSSSSKSSAGSAISSSSSAKGSGSTSGAPTSSTPSPNLPSAPGLSSSPSKSSTPAVSSPNPTPSASLAPSASSPSAAPVASSSSSPYPSLPLLAACPDANGTVYSTSNGNYIIECFVDRSNHDLKSVLASTFYDCVSQCASTAGCVDVSYAPGGACYLKNGQGTPGSNKGIWGAALYPYKDSAPSATTTATAPTATHTGPVPSCPADDKTYYYSGGSVFYIECYTDRVGGDLSEVSSPDFASCIDACAADSKCTDVSFNGNTCYLKSTVSLPVYNGGVLGAIRVGTYDASATQITATPTGAPTPAQTVTTTTTIYGSPYACQCTPAPTSLVGGSGPGSLGSGSSGVNCPSADGTTFTGSCGSQYTIECGIDRNNNDIGSDYAATFNDCMNQCDKKSGCVDVSYAGFQCYYKGGLGDPNKNSNVWGAKLISGCKNTDTFPKIKLHRKRVSPIGKVKRNGWYYVGPDYTYTAGTATATSTVTTSTKTVETTVTPPASGTTTITRTASGATTKTTTVTNTYTFNSGAQTTITTCPNPSASAVKSGV